MIRSTDPEHPRARHQAANFQGGRICENERGLIGFAYVPDEGRYWFAAAVGENVLLF